MPTESTMQTIFLSISNYKTELILNAITLFLIIILGLMILFVFLTVIRKKNEKIKKLSASNAALEKSNQSLENFAHVASHNLRAPVNNILSLCEMKKDNALSEDLKAEVNEKIHQSIIRLDSTLNDIIEVINCKSGGIKIEQLDIEKEFNEVLKSIDSQVKTSDIHLEANFSACPYIYFPKQFLNSIFINLLSNSIKYKALDRKLRLQLKTETRNGQCILHFKDNGIGIDLEKFGDKIFGLYQRFHSEIEGRGLGLYIIKSQIETMNGKIKVESIPNQGTGFQIYFNN